jgi:predicted nuclease of restriction endonuclease-like RecB superfamily
LLPRSLLAASVERSGGELLPRYVTERDHPWLELLIAEYAAGCGVSRRELRGRVRRGLSLASPRVKRQIATLVLDRWVSHRVEAPVAPRSVRYELFGAASGRLEPREVVMSAVAAKFEISFDQLERSLFADLSDERVMNALPEGLDAPRLAIESNLSIIGSLVARASEVTIRGFGGVEALARHARDRGLICRAESLPANGEQQGLSLELSGPFSIFRHTEVYGRALASLVPRLAWCDAYELSAECVLEPTSPPYSLRVRSSDPLGLGRDLERAALPLEERFQRDFGRRGREFELSNDPAPISAGGALFFPHFELRRRSAPEERFWVEFAGFWTRASLDERLGALRAAGVERLVLCVDDARACDQGEPAPDPRVVRFRKRLEPERLLAALSGLSRT